MPSLTCSAVLFDLDGVLIDSTPCVTRVWRQWAKEHGLDADKVISIAHGRRSIETVQLVAPHLDAESENLKIEQREIEDTEGLVVIPGAADLLASLPSQGWTVVTSGTRALATRRLQVAGLPVPPKMVTADDVVNGKPDPEPYLKGAEKVGANPVECAVVEDAPSGIKAARNAGMRVFGVPTTYSAGELRDATVLLQSLSQLRAQADGSQIVLNW